MSQTVLLLLNPVASHSSTFCSLLNFVQQPAINVATINKEALCQCLNGCNIIIPPLRQHREDILSFAMHFLRINNTSLNKNLEGFSPQDQFFFLNYAWYNNLSELKGMINTV